MTTPLRATYRLQLGPELTFDDVRALVPYLRDLGISHLYLSPCLQARAGSPHGYDIVDPSRLSEELGGEAAFRALAGAGLGVILDVVPNHMGRGDENRFWADPELRERFFDIDPRTGFHRRFFDIDDLAAVRQERDEVFQATHEKVLALVREGLVDGLRVDHPDGLADPAAYLRRLRDEGVEHVWVEKILQVDEPLRDWPVEGTVGYEFLNDVCALYVDPAGEAELTLLWEEISRDPRDFDEVALEAQREQARGPFAREVERLRSIAPNLTAPTLEGALARLPVYRTYVEPATGRVERADRRAIVAARAPAELARVLLLEERSEALDEFVTRFQQTSPPVTAKGVEDTAFYRYLRLVALNEVGGDPARFGLPLQAFHAANAERAERFPRGLLITQTHDTKRSGDVRARIGALAGMASEWAAFARRWAADAGQYLVLQTLIGAWPIDRERLDAYLTKALREAKRTSNWIEPDLDHEAALQRWAAARLDDDAFLTEFVALAARVAEAGAHAALGQTLLKLTAPGVPDVYQGDELESLFLVDPDNRRPVDWAARREALEALRAGTPAHDFGARKLELIWRALELRARRPGAFAGRYLPLDAGWDTCAFARGDEVIAIAPLRRWADARLQVPAELRGAWRDVLAGGAPVDLEAQVGVAELCAERGIALLERAGHR